MRKGLFAVCGVLLSWTVSPLSAQAWRQGDDPSPPTQTLKLIFVHHSTGGNWLADPNPDQPHGELGATLMANNYYVSATNYDWGPDGVGSRTDIPNWPEWFTGPNSGTIMNALFNEFGQTLYAPGDWRYFGWWPRLAVDPGGENQIIMFKSCFPNSDVYGNPDDPPHAQPNDWEYSVANFKAVYIDILTTFAAHQDKLFVVITAPPMADFDYSPDIQTPAARAANARACNSPE